MRSSLNPIASGSILYPMEADKISQSIEAMSEVLKMAAEQSTDLVDKLIMMNAENTVDALDDEMIGQVINLLI
jgi:hypothetical protein